MRSPLTIGLGISAALHIVAVLFYAFLGAPAPGEFWMSTDVQAGPEVQGTRIVQIVETEGLPDVSVEEIEQPELEEPDPVEEDRGGAPGAVDGVEAPPRVVTAAEVLRPDPGDSVMLRGVDPELARMTPHQEMEARVRWAISDFAAAQEAELRAREEALDWTHTDEDGNKWGVSPGKLHLGSLTLPLPPVLFGRAQGVDPAADEALSRSGELADQAARGRVWESWERRAQVIRERRDRERAERAAAGDTTRLR